MIIKSKNYYENHARKILSNNIVYFRIKKNWSQEDFADELGTTPTYVSGLENAKRNTRIDYIGHIADTLGVSIEDLFILSLCPKHVITRSYPLILFFTTVSKPSLADDLFFARDTISTSEP